MQSSPALPPIPYKIAVLVYIFNSQGKLLLLHRRKPPNQDLYSPIGGKLEQHLGESPYACALREIHEEVGETLALPDIRLLGIVSERAYASSAQSPASHWLMFCFEVTRPLNFPSRQIDEGRLEWVDVAAIPAMSIPKTDRDVIWPLVREHSRHLNPQAPDAIFSVHIDCTQADNFIVTREDRS
ncbi:MAG TPA: NUDIX domain-containing protein [Phycisphaerae bacterium]|jgi:8-oxo-dGTP diphosphatase